MVRTCWRPMAALLALGLVGPATQAQEMLPMPGGCARSTSYTCTTTEDHTVEKTYPVGPLLHAFGCCPSCPDLLVKFMTQCVAPESWSGHGGCGTMEFCPARMALVVVQTPEVHKQVGALLKAMDHMASVYAGPMSLVPVGFHVPPPHPMLSAHVPLTVEKSAPVPEPKQHFRFVLDNLQFRTGEHNIVKIKRVEVEYAGDGIDADVAKCAITLGGSEKSAPPPIPLRAKDLPSEEADKAEEKSDKAEKSEEKSEKAEPKKVEEEEDKED